MKTAVNFTAKTLAKSVCWTMWIVLSVVPQRRSIIFKKIINDLDSVLERKKNETPNSD